MTHPQPPPNRPKAALMLGTLVDAFKALLKRDRGPEEQGAPPAPAPPKTVDGEAFTLDLPGIQTEVGLRYSVGRADIYTRMLKRFRDAKAGVAGEVREALDARDPETAARLAHTMKSTALAIGAVQLSEAARDLEAALAPGAAGDPEALLAVFQERLDLVLQSLRNGL